MKNQNARHTRALFITKYYKLIYLFFKVLSSVKIPLPPSINEAAALAARRNKKKHECWNCAKQQSRADTCIMHSLIAYPLSIFFFYSGQSKPIQ
jgi:hypothetical protein